MNDVFSRRILDHIRHRDYTPTRLKGLAVELGVAAAEHPRFLQTVHHLKTTGELVIGKREIVTLPPLGKEVVGRIRIHERGFGFVVPDTPNSNRDLFVPPSATGGALDGDRVRALVALRRRGGGEARPTGRVTEILERSHSRFVGILQKREGLHLVFPDGQGLSDPIVVRDPSAKHAALGNKVVVELTSYPEGRTLAEGVITEVLGRPGDVAVETTAVCRAHDLPESFPGKVQAEAQRAVQRYEKRLGKMLEGREDLRDTYILTLDPPDAQDFDDAISIRKTSQGFELGVHIADVAAFVQVGSALDEEARERGNSVYLPHHVIPMLPEVLSNSICSLQPNVDRLTRSVFLTYDTKGRVKGRRACRSVIRSAHRLTYLEAQALIDGRPKEARKHARYDKPYTPPLRAALREMDRLARIIRERRLRQGMIVLDLPQAELVYDKEGQVVDAVPEDDAFTHKIIEAFMVEANEAVAGLFADLGVPLLRRIHPEPTVHDTDELRLFAHVAGYTIPRNPSRQELQRLLDGARGKPAARAVHFAVLRTLTRAEYTTDLIGHYALASDHYAHFTSPIRRYPDLLVHRATDVLLAHLGKSGRLPASPAARKRLAARVSNDPTLLGEAELRSAGRHCSATERNAEQAERALREWLVLKLLCGRVGRIHPGMVAGVTARGLYVQLDKYLVEGVVRTEDLPGGGRARWKINERTGRMSAPRGGRSLGLGDAVRVQIRKVDPDRRELGLLLE